MWKVARKIWGDHDVRIKIECFLVDFINRNKISQILKFATLMRRVKMETQTSSVPLVFNCAALIYKTKKEKKTFFTFGRGGETFRGFYYVLHINVTHLKARGKWIRFPSSLYA